MRAEAEIRTEVVHLEDEIRRLRTSRNTPGRSDGMRDTDAVSACIAAATLNTLAYVLGEQDSPMIRSRRLKQ